MKIGLIDVDSHNFPNLPLMKISAWHKAQGDSVEWWNGLMHYDRVYQSKVFDETYSKDLEFCVMADEIIKGGTGYGLDNVLPDEIEHIYPDYGLYRTDEAYGFLTRGCPRHCPFCIVSDKEGRVSHQVADLDEFWRGQKKIVFLDPNITACKDSERLFDAIVKTGARIEFNQGLDARLITDKHCSQLNNMHLEILHFAWDNYEFKTYDKLKKIRPLLAYSRSRVVVYVLTNYNTTIEQDLERILKLRELEYDPYVMIYDKPNAPRQLKRLQRWCNAKCIFRSCTWEEYKG